MMHACASPTEVPAAAEPQQRSADGRCIDVKRFLELLHPDGVFEVRSLDCPERRGGKFRSTASGYFLDHAAAEAAIRRLELLEPPAIYVTLNPVNPALLARATNRIEAKPKSTTSDPEVTRRRWLFVDVDPIRPAGVSATDIEMSAAMAVADAILADRLRAGWPEPLRGMSGNGAYLLWRIDLPNDNAATELVRGVLQSLAEQFSTGAASVDTSTFNASRICKVLGTVARKGDPLTGVPGVDDRPHRRSWFIEPAGELEIVTEPMLREIAAECAEPTKCSRPQRSGGERTASDRVYDADDVSRAAECLRGMAAALADDRETWIKIGIAAKTVSDSLFAEWDAFSQRSPKYDPSVAKKTWAGFKPRGGCGMGTLVHHARESGVELAGWSEDYPLSDMDAQEELIAAEGYSLPAKATPDRRPVAVAPTEPADAEPETANSPPKKKKRIPFDCELIQVVADPVVYRFRCKVSERYCELPRWPIAHMAAQQEFLAQTQHPLPIKSAKEWKELSYTLSKHGVMRIQRADPTEDINCVIAASVHTLLIRYAAKFATLYDVDWQTVSDFYFFQAGDSLYVQFDSLYRRMSDERMVPELTRKRLARVLHLAGSSSKIERFGTGGVERKRLWRFSKETLDRLDQIANGEVQE